MSGQIEVELFWKKDRNGGQYLFADPNLPANIDLSDVVFLMWPSGEDSPDYPKLVIKKKDPDRRNKYKEEEDDIDRDSCKRNMYNRDHY